MRSWHSAGKTMSKNTEKTHVTMFHEANLQFTYISNGQLVGLSMRWPLERKLGISDTWSSGYGERPGAKQKGCVERLLFWTLRWALGVVFPAEWDGDGPSSEVSLLTVTQESLSAHVLQFPGQWLSLSLCPSLSLSVSLSLSLSLSVSLSLSLSPLSLTLSLSLSLSLSLPSLPTYLSLCLPFSVYVLSPSLSTPLTFSKAIFALRNFCTSQTYPWS